MRTIYAVIMAILTIGKQIVICLLPVLIGCVIELLGFKSPLLVVFILLNIVWVLYLLHKDKEEYDEDDLLMDIYLFDSINEKKIERMNKRARKIFENKRR